MGLQIEPGSTKPILELNRIGFTDPEHSLPALQIMGLMDQLRRSGDQCSGSVKPILGVVYTEAMSNF